MGEISGHLSVPRSTVYYWIKKYSGCDKKEMRGKPRRVAMEIDERTHKLIIS